MTPDDLRKRASNIAGLSPMAEKWMRSAADEIERLQGDRDALFDQRCEFQARLIMSEGTCCELAKRADRAETESDSARRRIAELENKLNTVLARAVRAESEVDILRMNAVLDRLS